MRILLIPAIILALVAAACSRRAETSPPFFESGEVSAWPDSIRVDSVMYLPVDTEAVAGMPTYDSEMAMGNSLWRGAMAGASSESPLDLFLSEAFFAPEEAKEKLADMVTDGKIPMPGYPLVAPSFAWAMAAWEVALLTGDEAWVAELYDVVATSLKSVATLSFDGDGLLRGEAAYLTPLKAFYPASWQPINRFTSKALGVNAELYGALCVARDAATLLGKADEARQYDRAARELSTKINDTFWQPALGAYGSMLYGTPYPIVSPAPDNYGNLLCALLGIATPEMAVRLTTSRPVAPTGIPSLYPSEGEAVFSPSTQALQAVVAARFGSDGPFLESVAAAWIARLRDGAGCPWSAIVLRGIFGITLSRDGLSFAPFVPEAIGSFHSLGGLRYRDALLNVTLSGTGNRVVSMMIDGRPADNLHAPLPPDFTGEHHIEITLAGNPLPLRPVDVIDTPYRLPSTPTFRLRADKLHIASKTDSVFSVYIDGVNTLTSGHETSLSPTFGVLAPSPVHFVAVTANSPIPGMCGFSAPARVVPSSADAVITIPAKAITPRRPPKQITRPDLAAQYIELAARHNTRLTLYANIPEAGEYDICIFYSNATSTTGLRTLSVDGDDIGTLICPPADGHGWIETQPSTSLRATLPEGRVRLALTYIKSSTILLYSVRLIRRK